MIELPNIKEKGEGRGEEPFDLGVRDRDRQEEVCSRRRLFLDKGETGEVSTKGERG